MPLFRTDDPPDEGTALLYLMILKSSADFHLNSLLTFGLGNVVNSYTYNGLIHKHRVVGDQDDWQNVEDNVEERLDRLRGGGRVEHETAWWLFTRESAYSPIRLERELGWKPTPHGLPSHCDPSLFGWVDAFEDLLAVSSATPMMSFDRRETMNRVTAEMRDMARGHWFLFNRMQWQGLNEVFFPVYEPEERYRSPRSMEEWVAVRRSRPIPCNNWAQACSNLVTDIYEVGGSNLLRYLMDNPAEEELPEGEPTRDSAFKVFKALHDMTTRGRSEAQEQDVPSKTPNAPKPPTSEPAKTEEDLYLATSSKSDGKTPGSPLTSLFRLVGRAAWGDDMDQDARKTEHKTPDGGSETVFEKVQATPEGRICLISIEKKDRHGRVTSSEFHTSINQAPFTSPFWRRFWENARPRDGTGGDPEDSK